MVGNYNNSNQKNGFIILSCISFKPLYFPACERLSSITSLMLSDAWVWQVVSGSVLAARYLSCVDFYTYFKNT